MGIKVIKCQCCKGSGVYDQGQCGYCGGVGYIAIEEKPQPTKTLLDEFAMAAMEGLMAMPANVVIDGKKTTSLSGYATASYGMAFYMMKERARRDETGNVKEVE